MLPNGTNTGQGSNNNTFSYVDLAENTYTRKVNASSNVILLDEQGGSLPPVPDGTSVQAPQPTAAGWAARLLGGKHHIFAPPPH